MGSAVIVRVELNGRGLCRGGGGGDELDHRRYRRSSVAVDLRSNMICTRIPSATRMKAQATTATIMILTRGIAITSRPWYERWCWFERKSDEQIKRVFGALSIYGRLICSNKKLLRARSEIST